LELIAITESGELSKAISSLPEMVAGIIDATTALYKSIGYQPPWLGYLGFEDGDCVGACAFKSPLQDNGVEIAYFTFPGHESRGVATRMASELIRLAHANAPAVRVRAQTLPEESASTSILRKLGFRLVGALEHPEDGLVWEWQLTRTNDPRNDTKRAVRVGVVSCDLVDRS
jgi:RimJ/RimL family protein N-acetyltransferase